MTRQRGFINCGRVERSLPDQSKYMHVVNMGLSVLVTDVVVFLNIVELVKFSKNLLLVTFY